MKSSVPRWSLLLFLSLVYCSLAAGAAPAPKLTGIVRHENRNLALLELSSETPSGQTVVRDVILGPGNRDGSCEVKTIDEKSAKVTLMADTEIELKIEQTPGEELENRTLNLQSAKLEQALAVYQMFAKGTIIRPSSLPNARLDLRSGAALTDADALVKLAEVLTEKGLVMKPRGAKFVVVAPTAKEVEISLISEPPIPETGDGDIIPPGIIKFDQTDMLQVLDIYCELTGRTVLRPMSLPATRISLRNQTSLMREEAAWMFEAALAVEGIAIVREREKFAFAMPLPLRKKLPKFNAEDALAKATRNAPPGAMKFQDADLQALLNIYAELLGRKPLPIERVVPGVKFSLRTQGKLNQAEAIFALEAVAAVNGLRLEAVGEDQVQISVAARR